MTLNRVSEEGGVFTRGWTCAFHFCVLCLESYDNYNNRPDTSGPVSLKTHLTHDVGSVMALGLRDAAAQF